MKNFPQKLLLSSSFIHNLKSNYKKKFLIDFILIPSLKNTKKITKIYLSFFLSPLLEG